MGFWNEFSKALNKEMEERKEKRLNSVSYQTNKAEIELVNNKTKDLFKERRNNK